MFGYIYSKELFIGIPQAPEGSEGEPSGHVQEVQGGRVTRHPNQAF